MDRSDFLKKNSSSQSQIAYVLERYGVKPESLEDIYNKLLTLGSGPVLARAVTQNPDLLSEVLEIAKRAKSQTSYEEEVEKFIFKYWGEGYGFIGG